MQCIFINDQVEHLLVWAPFASGQYSAKSAYSWLMKTDDCILELDSGWSWIWKLRLPENIRHFVWMSTHGSLPTNAHRVARHVSNDSSCQRCGAPQETLLHALRECPKAQGVWSSYNFTQQQNFHSDDYKLWLRHHASSDDGALFFIICWFIWRSRNEEVFSDVVWDAWKMNSQIQLMLTITVKAYGNQTQHKEPPMVAWLPPHENYVKLNVDGSSLGNPGSSGYGGLIRSTTGEWIMGFSGFCGITTNLNAELLAIAYGLHIAWGKGYKEVICESDSQMSLDLIAKRVLVTHPYAPLIEHIRSFISRPWKIIFQHTLREGNACADWLAKIGANSNDGLTIWPECPPQLTTMVLANAMGVLRIRL